MKKVLLDSSIINTKNNTMPTMPARMYLAAKVRISFCWTSVMNLSGEAGTNKTLP